MKIVKPFFTTLLMAVMGCVYGQNSGSPKQNLIQSNYLTLSNGFNYGDSLSGFDEPAMRTFLISNSVFGSEYINYMNKKKREFIEEKYKPVVALNQTANSLNRPTTQNPNPGSKVIGNNNLVNSLPCVNEGFESTPVGAYSTATAVAGWSVSSGMATCGTGSWIPGSSEFSVVNTPVLNFPGVGTVGHSPLGGTRVARLNNVTASTQRTRISSTFPVTSSNNLFTYAYAFYFDLAGHTCCDGAGIRINVLNCSNVLLSCHSFAAGDNCNTASGNIGSWTVRNIDLTSYLGTCVTIECIVTDCSFGGHAGTALFDAKCGSQFIQNGLTALPNATLNTGISVCPGTNTAQLTAPLGYISYSWIAPPTAASLSPSQASLSSISVPVSTINPVTIYTVNFSTFSCLYTSTFAVSTFSPSQINIIASGAAGSCLLGSNGTATVQAWGSNIGYNYAWQSPFTTSVISTASVAGALAPGIYTVVVSAPNNSACGTAITTLAITSGTQEPLVLNRPFCGNTAYFSAGPGSNFQWYTNNSPVSGSTGTAATLTLPNPPPIVRLGRNYQGCRDSLIYTPVATTPGTIGFSNIVFGCPGSNNGGAIISFTSNGFPTPAAINYSVFSIGVNPSTYSVSAVSSGTYMASSLPIGQTFSVSAFDGVCYAGNLLTIAPLSAAFNYSVIPSGTLACNGSNIPATINFTGSASSTQYSYSWSPASFIVPGTSTLQSALLNPTTSAGNVGNFIYTVVVTPTSANCPVTKTISISAYNAQTPTISALPALCSLDSPISISVTPAGGNFSGSGIHPLSGVLTPSLSAPGTHTFTYSNGIGNCVASSTASFMVYPSPTINVSGNYTVCSGGLCVLTASGAINYTWVNGPNTPVYVSNPTNSTNYTLTGSGVTGNCLSTRIIPIQVNPLPVIQLSGNFTICTGQSCTIQANGANSFTWSNGAVATSQIFSPNTNMQFTVSSIDNATGCKNEITSAIVVINCTGLKETFDSRLIKFYPNPSQGVFYVESEKESSLFIYNSIGQLVLTAKTNSGRQMINLSAYSDGVYVLKVVSENGSGYSASLLKQSAE